MKPRFVALDGLRGAAALSVSLLHLGQILGFSILPHAYLAVDFFFVLSGFVIGYSYDDRIAKGLSLATFVLSRLRRLYPLIVAGVVAGAVYALARNSVGAEPVRSVGHLLIALAFGLLLLPVSLVWSDEQPFPLNSPSWSLLFELLSNFLYAFVGRHLSTRILSSFVIVSLIGLCTLAYTGLWEGSVRQGNQLAPLGGFALAGLSRVGYSFFVGVALFRWRNHGQVAQALSLNPFLCSIILVLVFAAPAGWPQCYDLIVTVSIFPIIVMVCANYEVLGLAARLSAFSGWLSYPLYAVHVPLIVLIVGALKFTHIYAGWTKASVGLSTFAIVILIACMFGKFYDEPIRKRFASSRRVPEL